MMAGLHSGTSAEDQSAAQSEGGGDASTDAAMVDMTDQEKAMAIAEQDLHQSRKQVSSPTCRDTTDKD